MDANEAIAELSDAILAEIRPIIEGLDTGLIISALINATTQVAMIGLNCDQMTAVKLIAATYQGAVADLGPTEH